MKVVDLHPDDLLDKEARGELSEVERTRLEAHLARCETCRFERVVRDDFAEELFMAEEDGPSQRLPPLVETLFEGETSEREEERESEPAAEKIVERRISTRPRAVRRHLRVGLLVAAALMIGSAATAGGVGGRVWAHVASALSLSDDEVTTLAPAPAMSMTTVDTEAPKPKHTVAPDSTSLVVPETSADVPAVIPVAMPAAPVETPASLFDAANKARNVGDYGRAITLHRKLETAFPHSREAHTSYATLGRLLLDRGDALGALQAFDAYDAKGPGPLDEAVLVGRATAYERLGRDGEARSTWTRLLRDFPDTPYREHAESKLKKP